MAVRAIRGATRLQRDTVDEVTTAAAELLEEIIAGNDIDSEDLISILFTATPDIRSAFPARAAREIGLNDVPLMCAQELDVHGAMPLVVRVLLHWQTDRGRDQIYHPYLRGTELLRSDPGKPA